MCCRVAWSSMGGLFGFLGFFLFFSFILKRKSNAWLVDKEMWERHAEIGQKGMEKGSWQRRRKNEVEVEEEKKKNNNSNRQKKKKKKKKKPLEFFWEKNNFLTSAKHYTSQQGINGIVGKGDSTYRKTLLMGGKSTSWNEKRWERKEKDKIGTTTHGELSREGLGWNRERRHLCRWFSWLDRRWGACVPGQRNVVLSGLANTPSPNEGKGAKSASEWSSGKGLGERTMTCFNFSNLFSLFGVVVLSGYLTRSPSKNLRPISDLEERPINHRVTQMGCKRKTHPSLIFCGIGPRIFSIIAKCSRFSWVWKRASPV